MRSRAPGGWMRGLAVAGVAAVALLLLLRNRSGPPGAAAGSGGAARPDPQWVERLLALEAQAVELDRTVWAGDLVAERHAEPVVKLWDRLRVVPDALAELSRVGFRSIDIPTIQVRRLLEDGVSVETWSGPDQTLTKADWEAWLVGLGREGWQLEQSEWRNTAFRTEADGRGVSQFQVTLHGTRGQPAERAIVRCLLEIAWGALPAPPEDPDAGTVKIRNLEILRRQGPPGFEAVFSEEIDPGRAGAFIDPLMVLDLDANGFPDIALGCRNAVYWNQGGGVFRRGALLDDFSPGINAMLFAEVTGDALLDCVAVDLDSLVVHPGLPGGRFGPGRRMSPFGNLALRNPFVLTAGDIDGDGDQDLWLAQYKVPYVAGQMPTPFWDANDGFPGTLLLNDGRGGFVDGTPGSGLEGKRGRRAYSASFVDFDDDGDLDLVMVSDFAGLDVFENDGHGHFNDVTAARVDESHAFGMAHAVGDFDRDGWLDLFMVGMDSPVAARQDGLGAAPTAPAGHAAMRRVMGQGSRMLYGSAQGFRHRESGAALASTGWAWGVAALDVDNDGDLDLYVANGHKSRKSVRDYEGEFWRHDLLLGDSVEDPARDAYFRAVATRLYGQGHSYGGFEKNRLYLNRDGRGFAGIGHLMGVSLGEDCRNVVAADLDQDGRMDLIVTTFEEWPRPRQGLHILHNTLDPVGRWIGFNLTHSGRRSPGLRVTLEAGGGRQTRWIVTGDSYRSQHPESVHFGLGGVDRVNRVEFRWADGTRQVIESPEVGRYHEARRPEVP